MNDGWPERLTVRPLTADDAQQLVAWRYDGPWRIYDLAADEEPPSAADGYFAVADTDRLLGFFCTGAEARVPGIDPDPDVVDLGVGMHPDWVGKGHGRAFAAVVLTELRRNHPAATFRAVIQAWNTRSRQLFRRLGFIEQAEHSCIQNGQPVVYIVATRVFTDE